MCGIAGLYGDFDLSMLDHLNDAQAHRGPDGAAVWNNQDIPVGLAHRRLAIIDLSHAGQQPMWDAQGHVVICFNGEIYNYRKLRALLESEGCCFATKTDTEVILNLYLRDGASCLKKLNGIFAFALWDNRVKKLLLARDGLGIKPLYYATLADGFAFASELKTLLRLPGLDTEIDAEAILYYTAYLYSPTPHTPLRTIRKFPPGHAAWVSPAGIDQIWQFYRLPPGYPTQEIAERDAVSQLRHHLETAVSRQMVADVPVGTFLSGGLDSSAVTAFARQHAQRGQLDCFTIALRGADKDGMCDDLPFARRVAKHLGVRLHEIDLRPDIATRFEEMIYFLDEPQADPAAFNVRLICELARQQGIKVLLSGAGGDDILSGYRRHYAVMSERYWSWLPVSARRLAGHIAQLAPADRAWGRRITKAFAYAHETPDRRIASYFLWLSPHWLGQLAGERLHDTARTFDPLKPMVEVLDSLPDETPRLNRMLALDSAYFLTDHNLNYTDKMSMATGVEVRVPLLDPDLIAFAARLPPTMKQRGPTGKWIFKRAMEPDLPRDVIYRPKTGFGAPLRYWLQNDLREYAAEALSPDALRRRGLFDSSAVRRLIDLDNAGRIDAAYPIFSMICIELWCQLFLDRKP